MSFLCLFLLQLRGFMTWSMPLLNVVRICIENYHFTFTCLFSVFFYFSWVFMTWHQVVRIALKIIISLLRVFSLLQLRLQIIQRMAYHLVFCIDELRFHNVLRIYIYIYIYLWTNLCVTLSTFLIVIHARH